MDVKVNYVGIGRRTVAALIDYILWMVIAIVLAFSLSAFPASSDNMDSSYDYLLNSEIARDIDATATTNAAIFIVTLFILYLVLNILMIMKFGGTPGKLLCGMYIKNANTFENVTLMQAVARSFSWIVFSFIVSILSSISGLFSILSILILSLAIFDQRKQTFYDKIAKTVVINYKPIPIAQESDSVS
ncbi:RDD family protein [Wolbachia endosymbiont of Folsomia candida]|uniref:RDD family protein n=1 Tax=Wolbachia endosymbiont of Folsomia candida TaxID=169402 RepID=UPI000B0585E0|nr:RDD family protein [Wolbachia endosymbiont of Folsomia candida]APR98719.1 RDD family protein [Wolbachia endosymbiont of Folsomia candida]